MPLIGLRLKPLDVLLFRDARPFAAGDSGRTQWPSPATFAGLVKAHVTRTWLHHDPARWHGHHDQPVEQQPWYARLRFRGPWPYVDDADAWREWNAAQGHPLVSPVEAGPLVPVPADIVRLGKSATAAICRLKPLACGADTLPAWTPREPGLCPLWLHPSAGAAKVEPASGWLHHAALKKYLANQPLTDDDLLPPQSVAVREDRTGIGIDYNRGVADQERGLIYSASFWRLAPGVCFYAEVELPDAAADMPSAMQLFPPRLTLPWGGEGRRVELIHCTPFDWLRLQPDQPAERLLSLLVTPGVFTNLWKPRENGALVAAATPKPLAISGWDLAGVRENGHRPRPRPTRFAVPAGAVYHWRRGAAARENALPPPLTSLCDKPADRDVGWGLTLSGYWDYCQL